MIITIVYLGGFVLAIWPISRLMLNYVCVGEQDSVDIGFSVAMGVLVSILWPLVAIGWCSWRISRAVWERVLDLREPDRTHPARSER